MEAMGIIAILIMVITTFVSSTGISNHTFFVKYSFEVDRILVQKDYKRIVTSGFLHVNWLHLIFNMLSFYFFSRGLESQLGAVNFLIIYFASLIGGNLLSLFIHRNHGDYSAVGASGAVCGIIFASVALFPGMSVSFFGLLPIAGWLYCILFVLVSIYGIRSRKDNIGHDAHLGGALIGMLAAVIMQPEAVVNNTLPVILITVPTLFFIFFIINRPATLLVDNHYFKHHEFYTLDDRYNIEKKNKQEEVDRILEKIHRRGMNSLTRREKEILKDFSKMK